METKRHSILARAAMTLLLVMLTAMTAWAAEWPSYITNVVLVGGTEDEAQDAKSDYSGYTWCSKSLNDGTSGDVIYIGYKTSNSANTNGGYITDFIVVDAVDHNPPSSVTCNGHTYYLCPADGGDYFANSNHGNLTSHASQGWNIYLYYTKEHFSDKRAVSSIAINDTKSGAIDCYKKDGTLIEENISLNRGVKNTPYVYMHIYTSTKVNRPYPEPTTISGLTYDGSPHQLIPSNYDSDYSGDVYFRVGTTGSYTSNVNSITATNAGTYTIYYYSGESYYGDSSVDYAHTMTATIALSPNSGPTVTCADALESVGPSPSLTGTNLSTGTITYKYATSQNGSYSATKPSTEGTYWVKATIAGDNNCNEYTTAAVSFKLKHDWGAHNNGTTANDAYVISTTEDLNLLSSRVKAGNTYQGKFFKLGGNIAFNKTTANNITPIGNSLYPFKGTFDGNGKTISGINISLSSTSCVGLFGNAGAEATIKNLKIDNSTIGGQSYVGAILGEGEYQTHITNCLVTSSVSVSGQQYYVGGIVGNKGTITGCASAASVSGNNVVGGIMGSGYQSTITNCVYTGSSVTSSGTSVGAIVGLKNEYTTLNYNYYTADLASKGCKGSDINGARKAVAINTADGVTVTPTGTATAYNISGITGYASNSGIKYTVGNSTKYYAGATETVSLDLTHSNATGNVVKYYDSNDNELTHVSGNTYTYTMSNQALSIKAKLIPDWALKNSGDTEDDAYVISTADQLNLLTERVNAGETYANKYFKLDKDITYDKTKENNYTPIGNTATSFDGSFDGQGHTISGVNINLPDKSYVGIFGMSYGGYIKNLKVANSTFTGKVNVGAILGSGGEQIAINNCVVAANVTVSGQELVGGIAGRDVNVIGCTCAATVSGDQGVGGIIGYIDGAQPNTQDCLYLGTAVTGTSYVGAIIGANGGSNNVANNYYTADLACGGMKGSDANGARKAVEITSTTNDLAFQPTGTATTYDVSGITGYADNSGIKYTVGNSTKYYAGATETVSLDITYTSLYEGFSVTGYTDGNEPATALTHVSDNTYTLVMPETTVDITPVGSDLWGEQTEGRDGSTADKAYRITSPAGLDLLASKVNGGKDYAGKYFELGDDITYDGSENNYTPIGDNGNWFSGTFDGQGHKVSSIRISDTNGQYKAIFGIVDGTVKNLVVSDCRIEGYLFIGGIVTHLLGTIENCHVGKDVTLSSKSYIGGIATQIDGGTIKGCTSAATIIGTEVSGIKAHSLGGIVGSIQKNGDNTPTLTDNLFTGTISGDLSRYIGAIVGYNVSAETTLTNNYHTCSGMGGFGREGDATGSDVDGATIAYELAAANGAMGAVVSTYGTGDYTGITVYEHGLAYNGKFYSPSPWAGSGTEGDPYVIVSTAGLDLLATNVIGGNSYEDTYFVLGNDIVYAPDALTLDLDNDGNNDSNYMPVGKDGSSFSGNFDGQGHTISGIRVNTNNMGYIGVLGVNDGTVKNLTVSDCLFAGSYTVGAIAGLTRGTVENCHVATYVSVIGNNTVGGVVGENDGTFNGGPVLGCTSAATLSANNEYASYFGGIAGYNSGTLTDNLFTGTIGEMPDGSWGIGAITGYNNTERGALTNNFHTCSGMGGVGNLDDATNTDQAGAQFAVSSNTKPDAATIGTAGTAYAAGETYEGITPYTHGLYYNGLYYYNDPNIVAWAGQGTETDPYVIRTTAELDLLATNVNGGNNYAGTYFELGADITYDGSENNYTPIGNTFCWFSGTFDGQGHTISGIRISETNGLHKAIFGCVDGTVKNLVVSDCRIEDHQIIGGIVALLYGTIENCHVGNDVTLSGNTQIGGIAGGIYMGAVKGCTSTATIIGTTDNGWNADLLGGIVGCVGESGDDTLTLTDNLFTGTISGDLRHYIGAIVGLNDSDAATLTNNYHACSGMGGVGNGNDVTGSDVAGALFAVSSDTEPDEATIGTAGTAYAAGETYEGITPYTHGLYYNGLYYYKDPNIAVWTGKGTEKDPYVIRTTAELDLLASKVSGGIEYNNTYFELGDDIAYDKSQENNYTPIGNNENYFMGHFDGKGYKVSGLNINLPENNYVGLFGYIYSGSVKNLTLTNSTIIGQQYVGSIAGQVVIGAAVENCHVTSDCDVNGTYGVGGIVCSTDNSTIGGCTSAATVSGTQYVSGIVGSNNGSTIKDCLYMGNVVSATPWAVGAIVGYNISDAATLTNNYYTQSGVGGVNGIDEAGKAEFAVSSTTKPDAATIGTAGTPYAEGETYQGITPYTHGLFYGGRYYWHGTVRRGDANGDSVVNISDAVAIVNYILGKPLPAGFNEVAADMNGDGRVTVTDAVMLVNMIGSQP